MGTNDTQIVFNYNVVTLELIRGITYRFRLTGGSNAQISFLVNSATIPVESIFSSSTYILRTNELQPGNIVLQLGGLNAILTIVNFQSILSSYDLPQRNDGKRILVQDNVRLETLMPTVLALNPTFYVRNDSVTDPQAQINLSFKIMQITDMEHLPK